ncbi:MAG: hypothetical protein M3O35_12055 [Acidobacteriota bacterium]|nr:hypothetical protein [Acidobacteriota bacterium]
MSNSDSSLNRAGAWFLRSGIQEPNGGVARYYRSDLGRNARVSTEISGYAVSALLYLFERTGNAEYREAALRAARFLARTAWHGALGIFPFEHSENGDRPEALAYFFDCGIVVRGLLAAWRATRDSEFLDAAVRGGAGMLADFCERETIHPILSLPGKQPRPHDQRWSASPGCYQLKSAMAWFDLHEATGDARFLAAWEQALAGAIASECAFLPGEERPEKTMDRLHAYLYFLEGLLPAADRAAVIHMGIAKVDRYVREIAPVFVRSDVYAQLLRIRLFAGGLDEAAAAREAGEASKFQLQSPDVRIDGGYCFGRKTGEPLPYVNPVSTAFCMQALAMWNDHRAGVLTADRHSLV